MVGHQRNSREWSFCLCKSTFGFFSDISSSFSLHRPCLSLPAVAASPQQLHWAQTIPLLATPWWVNPILSRCFKFFQDQSPKKSGQFYLLGFIFFALEFECRKSFLGSQRHKKFPLGALHHWIGLYIFRFHMSFQSTVYKKRFRFFGYFCVLKLGVSDFFLEGSFFFSSSRGGGLIFCFCLDGMESVLSFFVFFWGFMHEAEWFQ